jgi:hypothetical protein
VISEVADALLLYTMTTADIVPDSNPIFHLMMPHLNAAVSSRIYPAYH